MLTKKPNAANNVRLVPVCFVQQWRSHTQKTQAQSDRSPMEVEIDVVSAVLSTWH